VIDRSLEKYGRSMSHVGTIETCRSVVRSRTEVAGKGSKPRD
jgi:hypothetical protein